MTVYLVIPPTDSRTQSPLLRLWITRLLNAVVAGGLQERQKVHFLLDEAASLGHMDVLEDAVDKYRGYGVRLQLYYQSLGQLKKCWPEGKDQTLLSNVSQIFFGVNDLETAKLVSERLGKETIVVNSGGESTSTQTSTQSGAGGGSSSVSTTRGDNSNWQQSPRELLQPDEVMALDPRVAITFTPGVPPIWTRLVRYFEPGFASRVRPSWSGVKLFCRALALFVLFAAVAFGSVVFFQEQRSPQGVQARGGNESFEVGFPAGGGLDPWPK
jgi:type IV secretion system protein VirD4